MIVVESDEVLDDRKAMAALLMKPELIMLGDSKTLDSFLSKDDADVLARA